MDNAILYFGYAFNPVSFYYCFDAADTRVDTIVAEVNNTPWGEQHCYVLDESRNEGRQEQKRYRFAKDFHVSPFMPMDLSYDWRFSAPGEELVLQMQLMQPHKIFDATMHLKHSPITGLQLARVLIGFPLMTLKVIAAIYWEALRLWLKGIPTHPHPNPN